MFKRFKFFFLSMLIDLIADASETEEIAETQMYSW
jgi:hypothetical protein